MISKSADSAWELICIYCFEYFLQIYFFNTIRQAGGGSKYSTNKIFFNGFFSYNKKKKLETILTNILCTLRYELSEAFPTFNFTKRPCIE